MLKRFLNSPRCLECLILFAGIGFIVWFGVSSIRNYISTGASGIPLKDYGKRDDLRETADEQVERFRRMQERIMPTP